MVVKPCKDCFPEGESSISLKNVRPAPHPGPRCVTHHREVVKARRKAAHEKRVGNVYGLKPGQYEAIYKLQGGVCYICRRANGRTKRLSVDHDHKTGFVRGLLCSTCNKFLGHVRDDSGAGARLFAYLERPPAFEVIGKVKADDR